MKNRFLSLLGALVCGVMVLAGATSCEKMNVEGTEDASGPANVVLRVGSIEQVPFPAITRATVESLCTRLNFDVYDDQGMKVDYVNQKATDANFGTASFQLDEGHYYLVVVAHSGSKNPSFYVNEKVTISGSELGDTFWCCEEIEVGDGLVRGNLRSKGSYDVSGVARQLGGGGHKAAAGFTVRGNVDEVLSQALPLLQELLDHEDSELAEGLSAR